MSKKSKDTDKDGEEPKKKSKAKLFIILFVVILLGGGYEAQSILLAPHYKPGQKVANGTIFPLDQLTVNLSDGHLVQVTVDLQLTVAATPATMTADEPKFEDAVITAFGEQTYTGLLPATGRTAIKSLILKMCQKIAGTAEGAAQQVSGIYFTGFVIQ